MAERKPIRKSVRFAVLARDGFKCRYCGATPPDVVLHLDHVVAVANGGTNDIGNLVTSCLPCNIGKGVMVLPEASAEVEKTARPRPRIEFFWARSLQAPNVMLDARCIERPAVRESEAPWEWEEFNRYWGNRTPPIDGERIHYSTHGASTSGFSPYEAAMYAAELVHSKRRYMRRYVDFIDDLILMRSAGHLPAYCAPFVLRALHYENMYGRCERRDPDYEAIADNLALQAVAAFKPFIEAEHTPWGERNR